MMKKKTVLSSIRCYVIHYRIVVFFILSFTLLFSFFAFLYNYSLDAVFYTFVTTYFLLFIMFCIHFYLYYQKHIKLLQLEKHVAISLHELPTTSSLIEKDYQKLLHTLLNQYQSTLTIHSQYQEEIYDYYSLWVHQIKTPIAAMKLLLEAATPKDNEKLLELQKIEQYVEMVLQYLRLGSMSSDLVIKSHSLDEIIRDVIKKQASFFIHKKIKLQYTPIQTNVITDAKWFRLVIEQILTNSLKYTSHGMISIYIDPNNEHLLVIEDTGIGIYKEDLPRVFERGFTGYNGRINQRSTGIGLYLCKKIMDNLHHSISISSIVDQGTKVIINLEQSTILFE